MADPRLRAALIALALVPAGCDGRHAEKVQGSVTVKLPTARPAVAAPSFSFRSPAKAQPTEGTPG